MIIKEHTVKTKSRHKIRLGEPLAIGGQATAYPATDLSTGTFGIVKLFHDQFVTSATEQRIDYLVSERLNDACKCIVSPDHIISDGKIMGHFCRRAKGASLDELLQKGLPLTQRIQASIALTHVANEFENRDIAHGDYRADNVLAHKTGSVIEVHIIDMDNFAAPSAPPPDCIGDLLYLAPELRISMNTGSPILPDILSDRFAMGAMLHEIILLKHPASGHDDTPERFDETMSAGVWVHDPVRANTHTMAGGAPAEILNSPYMKLFRRSFPLDKIERPPADALNKGR
ncbi:hypothetical protein BVX94_03695, partial [bacterium B17]